MTNTHHYFLIMQKWSCWKNWLVEKGTLLFSVTFEFIKVYYFLLFFFLTFFVYFFMPLLVYFKSRIIQKNICNCFHATALKAIQYIDI